MYKIVKYCVFCGDKFHPKRIDARFCSASCRARFNRWDLTNDVYVDYVSLHIRFDPEDYRRFAEYALTQGKYPPEFAESICRNYSLLNDLNHD